MTTDLIDMRGIAKMFGVKQDTAYKWKERYEFPIPVIGTHAEHHPWYSQDEVTRWYLRQWPERQATWPVRLHRYYISSEDRTLKTIDFGPILEARGYLRAVRDMQYREWRTWHTGEGFVAERGNDVHVWYLDPTGAEPEDWFVYQGRIKGGSK